MVIQDFKKNCRACYACVRACPVKALKIIAGRTEILEEKCIFCGKCVVVCTRDGKIAESHIEKTRELLKKGKTVAILAPEWVASFYPVHPLKVKSGLLKLGFSEVQENTFGEELIAEKYRELFRLEETVIRSTCLPVVEWVEKFYPEFNPLPCSHCFASCCSGKSN
ncbi:MAG: 4Fe-4S binding protein [Candidatus Subteraquimicrobiales bacterium]|nr:4Fe-4S binding protein [Candidatus Subteraquimicrobiales bacterium]